MVRGNHRLVVTGRKSTTETLTSRQFYLNRPKTLRLLRELETTGNAVNSVFLTPELSADYVNDLLGRALPDVAVPADMVELAAGSRTGAAIFWGPSRKLLIRPPFPFTEQYIAPGGNIEPLRLLLETDFTIALVLVRLGAFAIGVWQGESLLASKTGTGLVHGRHRKGGSSQRRFERRREKQVDVFLERVCGHARQQIEPYIRQLDFFVYGGARTTFATLQKECPFLRQFAERSLSPLLDIARPRRRVLEAAIADILSSHITEWGAGSPDEIDTLQPEA